MKTLSRNILLSFLFVAASAVCGAGLPTMDITVSDSNGNLAYRGQTSATGTFATGKLKPGQYVVQFNAKNAAQSENFALVISAGRQKVVADSVAGRKFADGGVAMRVKVGRDLRITGQVANEMIADGKRFIWVENETGSHMGRWVEAGSARNWNVTQISSSGVQDLMDRGNQGSTR